MTKTQLCNALLRRFGRQSWIPFGLRDRLLRKLVNPDSVPSTPFACDFFGLSYEGDLSSFIDWSVYFYGAYERGLLRFLENAAIAAGPEAVFLDVGANVGQHSLFMSARVAQVHAFEPWQTARDAIHGKIALNGIGNIVVHGVGLSDHDHEATYYAPSLSNRGTGSFLPEYNTANVEAGTLALVQGDTYLAAHGVGRVDIIKLDAEGFEPLVLAGLTGTLRRCRPVVAFEMTLTDARDPSSMLIPFGDGWSAHVLAGGSDHYQMRPFSEVRRGCTVVMIPNEKAANLPRKG